MKVETKQRILALAREWGYRPNELARSLVTGRSNSIGIVVTTISDPNVAQFVEGIELEAQDNGCSALLATSKGEPERETTVVNRLESNRVDAVVVVSSRIGSQYREYFEGTGVPVVLVDNQSEDDQEYDFSVNIDNVQGAYDATSYLISRGHKRITYVGAGRRISADGQRRAGFRKALQEHGLEDPATTSINGDTLAAGGEKALGELLTLARRPTAVFCYNDMTAIGLMQAARERGVRIPSDLSVIGFDDVPFARFAYPALTTVAQPKEHMGRTAVKMCLELVQYGTLKNTPVNIRMQGTLLVRDSCTWLDADFDEP